MRYYYGCGCQRDGGRTTEPAPLFARFVQDNRLRVYDNAALASGPPSRTIVHSHDFNRYLTPFRAEWCPQDLQESTFLVGRYISEAFDGAALHPVDIMDANSGQVCAARPSLPAAAKNSTCTHTPHDICPGLHMMTLSNDVIAYISVYIIHCFYVL